MTNEPHYAVAASIFRYWTIGLNVIAARQQELAATALNDMTTLLTGFGSDGYRKHLMACQVRLATKTMDTAIANTRDIVGLAHKSGSEVLHIAQQRALAATADWLSDSANRTSLVDCVMRQLPPILNVIDKSGMPSIVGKRVRIELEQIEIAPLASGLLDAAVADGQHQRLLDALIDGLDKLVNETPAKEALRQIIRAQLPTIFHLYTGEPMVMNKIVDSINALIADMRTDAAHPVRIELDGYLTAFSYRLRNSPELSTQLEALKLELLERPELAELAAGAWSGLRDFMTRDARSEDSQLRRQLNEIGGCG